jgi:hypothetical protein
MPMFVCLQKDKWVPARCTACDGACGLNHPTTHEIGTRLFGPGFENTPPAVGKPLAAEGSDPK